MTTETLNNLLEDARRLATELLNRPPIWIRDPGRAYHGNRHDPPERTPPEAQGVYLFREGQNIRYIGLTKENPLRRRIWDFHLSIARASNSNANDFRDKLAHEKGLLDGEGLPDRVAVRKLMDESFSVVWLEIPRPDMRALVEILLVAWAREENQPLLNAPYGC
jgi:hypothetical protein